MAEQLSRRTVLKGLGTAIALPWLEAMWPAFSLAGSSARPQPLPKRMVFIYVPNGIHMPAWTPSEEGSNYRLPPTLEPLKPFKKDLLVLSGLAQQKAYPNGDGPGDHARAMSTFLTGVQIRKTSGADIHAGVSVDQVAAQKLGRQTKLASLEIGCEGGRQAGSCDSGYSCAYSSNLSWRTPTTPMIKEVNPRLAFERLFSNGDPKETAASRAKRERYRKSILDFVTEDAKHLHQRLGHNDQRKLDEYLTAVRDVERRIVKAEDDDVAGGFVPKMEKPEGIPKEYGEHIRLFCDLLAVAFQADVTRICTFVFANAGSNRSYRHIGVSDGHHDLSHHGGKKEKHAKLMKINRFHVEQYAYLLKKLSEIREGEGTLLDQCMVAYGSCIGDGNRHNHNDLPILLAGRGGGTIRTGRHIRYPKNTPLNNLWLAMLERFGTPTESLGDSTGVLAGLE